MEGLKDKFGQCQEEYAKLRRCATQVARLPGQQEAAASDFEYLSDKPIGSRSSFAQVFAVREKTTQLVYVMKRITANSNASSVTTPESVQNEIAIIRKLGHHHITALAFASRDNQGYALYITPYAECDLGHYLGLDRNAFQYEKEKVWKWFGCLLGALDYAHRSGVKHKDIKPENILIDCEGERVFLTDFGLSRDFSSHGNSMTTRLPPMSTEIYFAPECKIDGERTTAVDVFALGCVFAEILGAIGGRSRKAFRQLRQLREECSFGIVCHVLVRIGCQPKSPTPHRTRRADTLSSPTFDACSRKMRKTDPALESFWEPLKLLGSAVQIAIAEPS